MDRHVCETFDGVPLAWYEAGAGPPLVFANGIGVDHRGLALQVGHFSRGWRTLLWDYRGVGASLPLPRGVAVDVPAHARDLAAVLDAAGEERAAIVGWSMGVPVALELYRQHPDRVGALVLVCGPCGRMFERFSGLPGSGPVVERLLVLAKRAHRPLEGVLRRAARSRGLVPLARRVGFVREGLDREVWLDQVRSAAACDMRLYLGTMAELVRARCCDVLPSVRVPTLVVAGERDRLVRPEVMREMCEAVPGASFWVAPGAGHYCVVECPELLNARIEEHLTAAAATSPRSDRGWCAGRSGRSGT